MATLRETDLYAPVKRFLEARGYRVKAEVAHADLVAIRTGEDPVIVELKKGFCLTLLRQACARLAITDNVYVAVPRWKGRDGWRVFKGNVGLCKRLGVGVISVDGDQVTVHADPHQTAPRKSKARKSQLMLEFSQRIGDPNQGGTRGPIMTVYRQRAIRCARFLTEHGPSKGAVVARETGVERATRMMRDNHYGWFDRRGDGIYALTETGASALRERPQRPSPIRQ